MSWFILHNVVSLYLTACCLSRSVILSLSLSYTLLLLGVVAALLRLSLSVTRMLKMDDHRMLGDESTRSSRSDDAILTWPSQ